MMLSVAVRGHLINSLSIMISHTPLPVVFCLMSFGGHLDGKAMAIVLCCPSCKGSHIMNLPLLPCIFRTLDHKHS